MLHGVLPTVVLPNAMRPRFTWHGLGIMGSSEEIEVWMEEEKAEAEDSGINLDSAILNGGLDGLYQRCYRSGWKGYKLEDSQIPNLGDFTKQQLLMTVQYFSLSLTWMMRIGRNSWARGKSDDSASKTRKDYFYIPPLEKRNQKNAKTCC